MDDDVPITPALKLLEYYKKVPKPTVQVDSMTFDEVVKLLRLSNRKVLIQHKEVSDSPPNKSLTLELVLPPTINKKEFEPIAHIHIRLEV